VKTCKYKGREYELKWSGTTKFGERAKLLFIDNPDHDGFWAPIDAISEIEEVADRTAGKGPQKARAGRSDVPHDSSTCPTCGRPYADADTDSDDIGF
jgi:hypothetical protein